MVGNTKTWVSIGETMQEIATKEELSTMGGAKLVGTSSIGYKDGAVCTVTSLEGYSVSQYNDYIVLFSPSVSSSRNIISWGLTKGSSITITLLPIDFDYIVLQPDPMNNTRYNYYQYFGTNNSTFRYTSVNTMLGNLPGNYDITIHNKNSVTKEIVLQTTSQENPSNILYERLFTLSADSSTHRLTIRSEQNDSYTYDDDNDSTRRDALWIPDTIHKDYSAMIGPCLGLYTILYYKY